MSKQKEIVNSYFRSKSAYWTDLYSFDTVLSVRYQERRALALRFINDLSLTKDARILELGCGGGFTSVDIARLGFSVESIDSVEEMIQRTNKNALENDVKEKINASVGDVYNLSFPSSYFNLVVVLGLVPWLADINKALSEISRVLCNGGYVIISNDNRYSLNYLLDPANWPVLERPKMFLKSALSKSEFEKSFDKLVPVRYSRKKFDKLLASVGLKKIKANFIGFGPFTFLKLNILSKSKMVSVHRYLQNFADLNYPVLRSTGTQYLVLAKKI